MITDRKPLTFVFSIQTKQHSPRQIRHLDFISQFTTDIRHIKGVDNTAADALSRLELDALHEAGVPAIDFGAMAKAQSEDTALHNHETSSSLTLQEVPSPTADVTLMCDTTTGVPRPYVPPECRRKVFDSFHSLSHPGIRATQRLIIAHYVWPGINTDVRKWVQACLQCQ